MFDPADLTDMERRLAERGISVAALCRKADLAPTTWGRWKKGDFFPSFKAWKRTTDAFDAIISETPETGAAA